MVAYVKAAGDMKVFFSTLLEIFHLDVSVFNQWRML